MVDTVVLRYFLLVERMDLLIALLQAPRHLPLVVFDREDRGGARGTLSEVSESIVYHEMLSTDRRLGPHARAAAGEAARRLGAMPEHLDAFEVPALTGQELDRYADLTTRPVSPLALPLGNGEAACLALGLARHLTVVSDDNDALRALEVLDPGHPYERIRKLLVRAAHEGLCSKVEANTIHQEMTQQGFWDRTLPFPAQKGAKSAAKRVAKRRSPPRRR